MHFHLRDPDTGAIAVQRLLHQCLDLFFVFLTLLGQNRLDVILPDNFTHGAFGDGLHRAGRVLNIEQKVRRIGNDPKHGKIDIDDIFIARQHQAFFRHVTGDSIGTTPVFKAATHADIHAVNGCNLRRDGCLNGPWQMVIEARAGLRQKLAEAQHNALLIRLHPIKARKSPKCQQNSKHDQYGRPAAAWQISRMRLRICSISSSIFGSFGPEPRRGPRFGPPPQGPRSPPELFSQGIYFSLCRAVQRVFMNSLFI